MPSFDGAPKPFERVRLFDHRRSAKHRALGRKQPRCGASALHEDRVFRAPRERLEAECSRAGEKIEHPRSRQLPGQPVEERLAHPVRRWANARGDRQLSPLPLAADNAHRSGLFADSG